MEWMLYVLGVIALLGFLQLAWLIRKYADYVVTQKFEDAEGSETEIK